VKIAVTGTPGVGKTTVARCLAESLGVEYFDVTEEVRGGASTGYDEDRDVPVADTDALRGSTPDEVVLDGHIAHRLEPDYVVVLRCAPDVLRERLEGRGWEDRKVRENVDSEVLDIVLAEALEADAPVFEYDTTDSAVDETVEKVAEAVEQRKERVGAVDWSGHVGGVS